MRIDKPELRVQSVRFFCPEQWRLQHGLGLASGNRGAMQAGTRHHAKNVTVERATGCAFAVARGVAAALLIIFLLLLRR
jgi:protein-disulfide isomerase-like protein with CxxC motif